MCDCLQISMSSSAELTLGRPCHGMQHLGGSFEGGSNERLWKFAHYLKALEEERKKIDAFKRELPLCMQLLTEEIEASKERLADYQLEKPVEPQSTLSSTCDEDLSVKSSSNLPVLEEFIPIKKPNEETESMVSTLLKSSKSHGVVQTKFWSPEEAYAHGQEMVSSMTDRPYKKRDSMRMVGDETEVVKPILSSQKRGGAFLPFSGSKKSSSSVEQPDMSHHLTRADADASQCTDVAKTSSMCDHKVNNMASKENQNVAPAPTAFNSPGQTAQRKPRRCWSPELHQRFVNALQQLGGSEVATPKQIRELMKVDGLTNDEVKSHLQKYRLHTRRPNPSFHAATAAAHASAPQVVVLGGIWVPQEFAAHATQAASQQDIGPEREVVTQSYSDERYVLVNSATASSLPLHPALYCNRQEGGQPTMTQSQGSSQGPLHHFSTAHSSDAAKEQDESLGEEGNDGCSWKGSNGFRADDMNANNGGRVALRVHNWIGAHHHQADSGEEDSEAEYNGRVYETPH